MFKISSKDLKLVPENREVLYFLLSHLKEINEFDGGDFGEDDFGGFGEDEDDFGGDTDEDFKLAGKFLLAIVIVKTIKR